MVASQNGHKLLEKRIGQ